ncbi:hypothetical protein [Aphanothece sacrum]|nr:hypothetical protein [Aphanothece sacrum]
MTITAITDPTEKFATSRKMEHWPYGEWSGFGARSRPSFPQA